MVNKYFDDVHNDSVRESLLDPGNLSVLEGILSDEIDLSSSIKKSSVNSSAEVVSESSLKEIFPGVCFEINDLLGVEGVNLPSVEYHNFLKKSLAGVENLSYCGMGAAFIVGSFSSFIGGYPLLSPLSFLAGSVSIALGVGFHFGDARPIYDDVFEKVVLKKEPLFDLIPTIGHEYAHHVQKSMGVLHPDVNIFAEGQARGIQRKISSNYSEREGDLRYLKNINSRSLGEFMSSYLWICQTCDVEPGDILLKNPSLLEHENVEFLNQVGEPTTHALGNTFFSIKHKAYGDGVFKYS